MTPFFKPFPIRLKTWLFFAVFVLANSILSFAGFSNGLQLAAIAMGILLPLFILVGKKEEPASQAPIFLEEFLPPVPRWVWLLMIVSALFLRFYKLDEFFPFPIGSEALNGRTAIDLSRQWNWKFFYYAGQHTPLLFWTTGFWFHYFHPVFLNLRLTAALSSLVFIPFAFLAMRPFFSKSFCLIGTGLMVFSLWPLEMGRCCEMGTMTLLWECACFSLTAAFLASKERNQKILAGALGFTLGLCYWTFPVWPFVVLLVLVTVFGDYPPRMVKNGRYFPAFLIFFLIAFFPFLWATWREGYSLSNRFFSSFGDPIPFTYRFSVIFSYFSSLLWGPLKGVTDYLEINFERLNPLWGAAFLLGLAQIIRYRSHPWARWTALAFGLCSFPAFFSSYVETTRIVMILPPLLLITAWGLGNLLVTIPKEKRFVALSIFWMLSSGVDAGRIVHLYQGPDQVKGRNLQEVLNGFATNMGPGMVFSDFWPMGDDNLFVSTHDFNALENPEVGLANAKWAVLSTNVHYYPFLSTLLPGSWWYYYGNPGYEEMLGLFPVNEENRRTLEGWVSAHHYFHRLVSDIANINGPRTYTTAKKTLEEGPQWVGRDRFLQSCYWETAAQFYYLFDYQDHYDDLAGALKKAIEKGYGAAHLYYKLGSLYLQKKNFTEARKAFEMALRVEPGYGDARNGESLLERMEGNP